MVLTVRDIAATVDFYTGVLGMTETRFGEGRVALIFGRQKIDLHRAGAEFEPKSEAPTPGYWSRVEGSVLSVTGCSDDARKMSWQPSCRRR